MKTSLYITLEQSVVSNYHFISPSSGILSLILYSGGHSHYSATQVVCSSPQLGI